jgi:hypothetical protein
MVSKPRKLQSIAELPFWFLHADYKKAEKLDALGWYYQLEARVHIAHTLTWRETESEARGYGERHHEQWLLSRDLMLELKSCPVFDEKSETFQAKFVGYSSLLHPPSSGVSISSIDDISEFLIKADVGERDSLVESLTGGMAGSTSPQTRPVGYFTELYPKLLLKVDLDVPSAELARAFDLLVADLKRKNKSPEIIKQRYRGLRFEDWVRIGILPYLDLKAWELEEGVTISLPIMTEAIFKDMQDDISPENEETLRKTTAKLATQIFHGNVLKVLATQALAEISPHVQPER